MNFLFQTTLLLLITYTCCVFSQSSISNSIAIPSHQGFDTIAGALPALVKAQKRPYLVISNIEVPPQKTVTIEPGVIFLFKNFSGLHVRGRLIARGNQYNPIIFTSEYDRTCNQNSKRDANPFDWDGIYMTLDAIGSQMSYCNIMYSVYGLLSDTKLIRLDPVTFKDNGKCWITIENEEIPVSNDAFRYVLDKNDPLLRSAALDLIKDPLYSKRTSLRVGSIVGSLGGLCMIGINSVSWYKSERTLRNLSNENDFLNLNQNNGSVQWKNADKERTKDIILTGSGLLLTTLGITGLRWSFTF